MYELCTLHAVFCCSGWKREPHKTPLTKGNWQIYWNHKVGNIRFSLQNARVRYMFQMVAGKTVNQLLNLSCFIRVESNISFWRYVNSSNLIVKLDAKFQLRSFQNVIDLSHSLICGAQRKHEQVFTVFTVSQKVAAQQGVVINYWWIKYDLTSVKLHWDLL